MFHPISLFIGLRYTQAKQRNQFISFVSLISLLGMILGVFALVVVLSVMNGFEKELRDRILAVVPHGYLESETGKLADWPVLQARYSQQEGVEGVAPYIDGNVMLSQHGQVRPAQLVAVAPHYEVSVSSITENVSQGAMSNLQAGEYGIVVGQILARNLGLRLGDSVVVLLPQLTVTPVGLFPRQKRFRVVGLFSVGAQLDASTVFIHLQDGQKLFQLGEQVKGLRFQFSDLFQAQQQLSTLQGMSMSGQSLVAKSWQQTQGSLFKAVQMEKTMVAILLLIIVAIAAFNIVSILIMMVAEKRSAIAVLRTMGASPSTIMQVFMIQGVTVGCAGIVFGLLLGVPVAMYVGSIVAWFEQLLGLHVFNPQVYFITQIPSVVEWRDIALITGSGVLLSVLATLYPAWRAAQIQPAEALRYE